MIEEYKPTRENIKIFLKRITERVKRNNKIPWKSQHHEARL